MTTVNLSDQNISDNVKAIKELKQHGFTDAEIQILYDKQVEKDNSN